MKLILLTVAVFFSATLTTITAQSKDAEKYRKESEQMRQTVWAWDKPQFKVKDIPQQYSTASKVIIARHTELTADSKSKFGYYAGFGFGSKKELSITEIVREMVKINDKSAVTEYSELSFTQFKRTSGFLYDKKTTLYIGIRVIKPNGTIKELNADDIVLTKDEAVEKKAKVAIADLQPGDVLDYFMASEQFMTNDLSVRPYELLLFDEAPIMSFSFHAQLGKKYSVVYHSFNGAPDLQLTKNDDDDNIIDVQKTNIKPFETSLWVAPGLQLPFIRIRISLEPKKNGEIVKTSDNKDLLQSVGVYYSSDYFNQYCITGAKKKYNEIESDAKSRAKQANIPYKDLGDAEKAAQLFYSYRFNKLLNFDIDQLANKINIGYNTYDGLATPILCTLKAGDLNPAILISNDRLDVRMNEIMESKGFIKTTYLADINKFFSIRSVFDMPMDIPKEIEGLTDTRTFTFQKLGAIVMAKKEFTLTDINPGISVPVTTSDKNAHIENLKLSLTADRNNLAVLRSTTLKGYYKLDAQRELILYEDFYESERKAFNEEKSLLENLADNKKGKKIVDEVKNAFDEARKKQKDAFVKEAKDWFEQDITDLKDYKTDTLGVRHTAPNFVYSSSFNLGGLVKKAGNNFIIEIGKIQGQPLFIKDEQRKRDLDVYMPFARSLEYNINLEIPQGYTAEGVAALNKKLQNDAGSFIVEASATDKIVTIKIKKHYLHNFEQAKNWEKIVAFTDAAKEWVNSKLLFKKK